MGTHRPPVVMPDMKRRRASTGERIATIMTLARRLPLTRQVLADQLADATPSQMEFMESWMNAEIESRERSKRSRLLKAAGFPADKELGGYDWTPIRFPVDYGRGQITTLDFIACIASMFVGRVRQCFSAVWADGFPRCRHRFPVM